MNKELLRTLEIDESLGLQEIVDALEAKQFEYLERAQGTNSDERRKEIEEILEQIEQEISKTKEDIRNAQNALIADDGTAAPEPETPAPEPEEDKTAAKIEEIKQREAQEAEAKRAAAAAAQQAAQQAAEQQQNPSATQVQSDTPMQPDDPMHAAMKAYHNKDYDTAFRICTRLANEIPPVAAAQYVLSSLYHDGCGCVQDWDGFDFWSKHACDNGEMRAKEYRATRLLLEAHDHPGKLEGKKAFKQEQARYAEALDLLEQAGDSGVRTAMETYIKTIEIRFQASLDPVASGIRTQIKPAHVKKAMEYCKQLSEQSTDAYEAKQWQDRMHSLKRGKPYKGPKPGKQARYHRPIGCVGWFFILFFGIPMALMLISGLAVLVEEGKLGKNSLKSDTASSAAVAEPAFGTYTVNLHDVPADHILDSVQVSPYAAEFNADYEYIYHDESWDNAFIYRAGNGEDTAYTDYQLDGCFGTLRFRATPMLGYDDFFDNTVVQVAVTDLVTGETLYDGALTGENNELLEPEVDVTGREKIRLSVSLVSGGNGFANLGYSLIKDAYLLPAAAADTAENQEE